MAACPKCGVDKDETHANCRKCGLAHDKWAAFEAARGANSDVLDAAWKAAVAKWDDPAAHEELLRLVTQHDAWAWVATRYRERGDSEHLERVKRMAEATMMSTATPKHSKTPEPYRNTMAVLAVLMIIVIVGLFYAMGKHRSQGHGDGTGLRPPGPPIRSK